MYRRTLFATPVLTPARRGDRHCSSVSGVIKTSSPDDPTPLRWCFIAFLIECASPSGDDRRGRRVLAPQPLARSGLASFPAGTTYIPGSWWARGKYTSIGEGRTPTRAGGVLRADQRINRQRKPSRDRVRLTAITAQDRQRPPVTMARADQSPVKTNPAYFSQRPAHW